MELSARAIQLEDVAQIAHYWASADADYLKSMGADIAKLPSSEYFTQMLTEQIHTPMHEKQGYATIWMLDGQAVGHCNVNKIEFGKQAWMHLHLWQSGIRRKGMGTELVKKSLPFFFEGLQLEQLFCEPYALNPAPNKTLERVGFELEKQHVTIPGPINFEQEVKLWKLSKARYQEIVNAR